MMPNIKNYQKLLHDGPVKWAVALGFSLWGFYLRCQELADRDLWGDEIFQLSHSKGPFQPVWQRLA